jgi:hypothetical protein
MNIDIDLILTEWCYRLPKGYPTTSRDYETLYDVLLEVLNISTDEARLIVERARGNVKQTIAESIQFDSIENQLLINAIQQTNKTNEFREFLNSLPTEADAITLNFLNQLNSEQSEMFASLLYTLNGVNEDELNTINFKNGFYHDLFKLETKGLGKGEILLAALVKGSKINGGGVSFDMTANGRAYEIKDYTGGKGNAKSIRLGTKGSVTRFKFWDEIVTTLKRLDQLRGTVENPKFSFHKYFNESLLNSIAYLDDRRTFILAGNLNMKDKQFLMQFYREANALNSEIQGYTNVILRGPNATPIEMSIEPLQQSIDGTLTIKPIDDGSQDITYINTELRRLKYVRQPEMLDVDLQEAVDSIIGNDLQFIVFRKDRIRVTNEFRYVVIDAGKIRIIETAIGSDKIDLSDTDITEEYEL